MQTNVAETESQWLGEETIAGSENGYREKQDKTILAIVNDALVHPREDAQFRSQSGRVELSSEKGLPSREKGMFGELNPREFNRAECVATSELHGAICIGFLSTRRIMDSSLHIH
jgi:hypothetical protein